MARVVVTDDAWREFKTTAEAQGKAVSVYLGELVEKEAARLRRAHAGGQDATVRQSVDALAEARALRDDLAAIADRLEESVRADRGPGPTDGEEATAPNPTWGPFKRGEPPSSDPA